MPRKTSAYTIASRRTGNSAGPPVILIRATASPSTRTSTSTTMKIRTSSQNASRTSGKVSRKSCQEKKVSRTSGHPGLVRIRAANPPSTTTLEIAEIASARRLRRLWASARSARRPRAIARRSSGEGATEALIDHRRVGLLSDPGVLDVRQLARVPELVDRERDAVRERRVLLQQSAPLIAARGGELADHLGLGNLDRGQIEGRGNVHDHRVHRPVLERLDDVVGSVEHLRLVVGLDLVVDRVEAGGPDLDAEVGALEVVERGGVGGVGVLEGDDGLLRLVVRRGEVHLL